MGRHAIIAGGSLGGLMTAILLRRQGWSVDIFEKVADDLADRGGGITTQDRTWAIVTAAGLDGRDPPGVRLNRRMVFAADGSVIDARDVDQIVTSWDTLYRLLRQQIPDAHIIAARRCPAPPRRATACASPSKAATASAATC